MIYVVIAPGAIMAIPFDEIVKNHEISTQIEQMIFIGEIYSLLTPGAWLYYKSNKNSSGLKS